MNKAPQCKRGSALLLALVTIVVLSSLMVGFLFQVKLEGDLARRYRFRMKAKEHAQSGLAFAKLMMSKATQVSERDEEEYGEDFYVQLQLLGRGLNVSGLTREIGNGTFTLYLLPENGRRNVNQLPEADWEWMLENAGVPEELQSELIDAFLDWTDPNDLSRLNGAESEDPFYEDRGYEVKNAPLDRVEELLLIKGFTPAILYGGSLAEYHELPEVQVSGIARLLTVYGDASLSLNSATRDSLLTLSGMSESAADELLEIRSGLDGIEGTEDDGIQDIPSALARAGLAGTAAEAFSDGVSPFIRVVAIGEEAGVRVAIWAVLQQSGRNQLRTLAFREEELP